MVWTVILMGLGVMAAVIWRFLHAVAGRGGARDGDASAAATKTLAQIDAFRVSRTNREAWDGVEHYPGAQGNDGGYGA